MFPWTKLTQWHLGFIDVQQVWCEPRWFLVKEQGLDEMRKEQGRITFLASENLSTLISTCLPLFLVVCLFSVVLILILLRLC